MTWFFPIHYFLHLIFPGAAAYIAAPWFKESWLKIYIVLLGTMMVDLDHLLANPVYDASRCGIGFHPLHSWPAWIIYILMIIYPNFWGRVVGIGLIFHMLVDWGDCFF